MHAHVFGFNVCFTKFDFYLFVLCGKTALNIRATMKRRIEAIYGPPIPATYGSPTQNVTTETTSTKIQTEATIKLLFSIVLYRLIGCLCRLLLSEDLMPSYLCYCLGFLVFRLQEGSFNRLPITVI